MNETGIILTGPQTTVPADYESFQAVSCSVTEAGSRPFHAVVVSVSNNGQVASQSQQHLYVAYNPVCYSCSITGTLQGTCTRKVLSILYSPFLHYRLVSSLLKINIGNTGNQNHPDLEVRVVLVTCISNIDYF